MLLLGSVHCWLIVMDSSARVLRGCANGCAATRVSRTRTLTRSAHISVRVGRSLDVIKQSHRCRAGWPDVADRFVMLCCNVIFF